MKETDGELRYNLNPKRCKHCDIELAYSKRKNDYCCQAHGAMGKTNRKGTGRVRKCAQCGTDISSGVYCGVPCHKKQQFNQKILDWHAGGKIGYRVMKRWLAATYGSKCSVCGIVEWQGKTLSLELEHKDGNSDDSSPENVCLICPNCHSQTDTYKCKNKGNGRHFRRLRYAEGKSY